MAITTTASSILQSPAFSVLSHGDVITRQPKLCQPPHLACGRRCSIDAKPPLSSWYVARVETQEPPRDYFVQLKRNRIAYQNTPGAVKR